MNKKNYTKEEVIQEVARALHLYMYEKKEGYSDVVAWHEEEQKLSLFLKQYIKELEEYDRSR